MKRIALPTFLALATAAFALPAFAFEEVKWDSNDRDLKALTLMQEYFPDTSGDVVPWTVIGLSKENLIQKGEEVVSIPAFDKQVMALDGQVIKVRGFMLPLEADAKQKRFILSPLPADCPYCLPAGPNLMIEVECKQPVTYSYDPVVISGRMKLLSESQDGLFYRLLDSVEVPES